MTENRPQKTEPHWPTAENMLEAIRDDAQDWLKGKHPIHEEIDDLLEAIVYNANCFLKSKGCKDEQRDKANN